MRERLLTHQQDERDGLLRPELLGHSNLDMLPAIKPAIPLYSIENNDRESIPVEINGVTIGGPEIVVMAGLCSLENQETMLEAAIAAKNAGAKVLRGGAFKPRTSPYSFQGRGEQALIEQRQIADDLGMLVVSEATGERNLPVVAKYADIIQTGARNAQNFELLAAVGKSARTLNKAVLYKRGQGMSVSEWLWGAEYILATGCSRVILCERGTIMSDGSYGPDLEGMQEVLRTTHLPTFVDPTHSSECAEQVPGNALSAVKTGADGLIIEVHPNPAIALCDGHRATLPEILKVEIADRINEVCPIGRYYNRNGH